MKPSEPGTRGADLSQRVTESVSFTLNGLPCEARGASQHTTVLDYLRHHGLTGSKQGCAEGDCGACTVALVERGPDGRGTYRAVNSCIMLLPMLAGREVVTVEGLSRGGELHPVQAAMVESYGSQCGYCTPGFVMSMLEGFERRTCGRAAIADQLAGNLCRCTGYRPIREAMERAVACPAPSDPRPPLQVPDLPPAQVRHGEEFFERPTSMEALLRARAADPAAVLVAGATELGVEVNKKLRRMGHLISVEGVPSLQAVRRETDGWHIGGAASLTAVEEAVAAEVPPVAKMLAVFASRQIRNRATLAGNLVTASPVGDMAPVLLSLGAEVRLASVDGARALPLRDFFVGYRRTAMAPHEILEAVRIPITAPPPGGRIVQDAFKVSKRREMDIAIVAAGFWVALDADGRVVDARLAYGGVAALPVRAYKTEAWLQGKAWEPALAEAAAPLLRDEFSPIDDVRGGALFRRELAASLFEKLLHGERSLAQDAPPTYAPTSPSPPPPASYALRHESALGHVTGRAQYTEDAALRRPMLELWPVCAPHAHARIVSRDVTRALAVPGVHAVLLAEDVPGLNDVGAIRHDEALLADREVSFHGQMVAVVVGESQAACREGAAAVEVVYEPLPALLSIEAAMAANSYHTEGSAIRRGDATAALATSPRRLRGSLSIGGQEHFYLETHAASAELGDDGDVHVVSSTQHPSEVQACVAHVLGLPRHKIVVQSPRMGGAFGGKETQGNAWAALAALGASRTGRPCRVQCDRDVDMTVTGKRHPFRAEFDVGFADDGRLLALDVRLVSDGGWALDLSESICDRAQFHIDNCYYVPHLTVQGRVAKTHHVSHTAFRGFGGPQGMVVIEDILDRVARRCGLPPEVVRERNLYHGTGETNTTHYGQLIEDNRIQKIWHTLKQSADWSARRAAVDAFNRQSLRIKRGLAITPVKFGISFTASFLNQAGALVLLYRDGSAQVNHAGTEMGQGLYTKIVGVVMRELGLPADKIRVMKTQTDKIPNTSATAASSGADLNGAAVAAACRILRERLARVALALWGDADGTPEGVVFADGLVTRGDLPTALALPHLCEQAYLQGTPLSATGFYRTPDLSYDRARGRGKPFHYFACGAAVTEIELDGYTGMKKVLRTDILHDVGDSLNPGIDRGQIEGGFVQGMGWLTGEELKWDSQGRLLTHSASTYQIPTLSDAPMDFRVALLPDAATTHTIHGSKAVGEPPLMLAISVREALRDAVAALRGAAPGEEVALPSPATHEQLFLHGRGLL
jgi:xanthine dehydrogenase molybdopterin binding subunit/xanthine dehydrogenase small subunit